MSLQLNSLIMSDKQAGMEVIMAESIIKVENLVKSFGDHEVLKKIDFEISKGEVVCIIGSSGSGKSTLLRCINHLETPTGGKILFHGEEVKNTQSSLSKYRSQVGMVFQSFNLFNNMTVLKNCMFGVQKILHLSKEFWCRGGMESRPEMKPIMSFLNICFIVALNTRLALTRRMEFYCVRVH